ncbi:protein kinase [Plakobranchus ocellatus]|uniref:non-specific serine/threonine protein kinase n=1 Tax=Plakobranchus ocellatus TaxID=259542 RepID=A0AAV4A080_9GAST|nr:protein kinase [Plakobranchus ocellatus]
MYTANITKDWIKTNGWEVLLHPADNPDYIPSFWATEVSIFGWKDAEQQRQHHESYQREFLQEGFFFIVQRRKEHINHNGDNVEQQDIIFFKSTCNFVAIKFYITFPVYLVTVLMDVRNKMMELCRSPRLWSEFLKANGYQLDKCIGHGSFGDVYAVTCSITGQAWAVKRLVARKDIRKDIYAMAEIAALASITHETVVKLHEVLLSTRMACIFMELAPEENLEMLMMQSYEFHTGDNRNLGTSCNYDNKVSSRFSKKTYTHGYLTLRCDLARDPSMVSRKSTKDYTLVQNNWIKTTDSPKTLSQIHLHCLHSIALPFTLEPKFFHIAFTQITSALAYCHSINLAHRDINPSNVLIFSATLVKLADFGLCFRCRESSDNGFEDSFVKCSDYLGHDHYLAPEVRRRKPFYAMPADVWSLGCLLYFMLQFAHPPLYYNLFADSSTQSVKSLVPKEFEEALQEKCIRTLSETLKTQITARPSVGEILKLWDT